MPLPKPYPPNEIDYQDWDDLADNYAGKAVTLIVDAAGRKQAVGYRPKLKEFNRDWTIIGRVIVHLKYRTIGLGARLVRETLPMVGRRYVELITVMAEYNPFAERAGMNRIQETKPHPSVWTAMDRLHGVGVDSTMMASEAYNLRRLKEISDEEINEVREILLGVSTHYYKRLMSTGRPYVRKAEFRDWVATQPRERLSHCLSIFSVLRETKVYLFWSRDLMITKAESSKNG